MSKRHRHNLARLNRAKPWMFHDRITVERADADRKLFSAERAARAGEGASGADIATGYDLDLAVMRCLEIHLPSPPRPDVHSAAFNGGKPWHEVVATPEGMAAWNKAADEAHAAWQVKWGPTEHITWGEIHFAEIGEVDITLVTPSVPCWFTDGSMIFQFLPGRGWQRFHPTTNLAQLDEVFIAGSNDMWGSGQVDFDADCFSEAPWCCSFSGNGWSSLGHRPPWVGINGWGHTRADAICRAYVHKMTTVAAWWEAEYTRSRTADEKRTEAIRKAMEC